MDNNNMFSNGQQDQAQSQTQQYQSFNGGEQPQNPYQQNPYEQPQNQYQQNPYEQPQNQYQQNPYQADMNGELEEPVSMGEWLVSLLIMIIPCVNIIMMFVWAFGDGKKSKSNYFKASLIMLAIGIVLSIILSVIIGASAASLAGALLQ